jgi:hypothetical protein
MNTVNTQNSAAALRGEYAQMPNEFNWRAPDAVMQEIWAVKAQINKECNYSVDKILDMARASRVARLQTLH